MLLGGIVWSVGDCTGYIFFFWFYIGISRWPLLVFIHICGLSQKSTLWHRNHIHLIFLNWAKSNTRQTCFKPRFLLYLPYKIPLNLWLIPLCNSISQSHFIIIFPIWRYGIPSRAKSKIKHLSALNLGWRWWISHWEFLLGKGSIIDVPKVPSSLLILSHELLDEVWSLLVQLCVKSGLHLVLLRIELPFVLV